MNPLGIWFLFNKTIKGSNNMKQVSEIIGPLHSNHPTNIAKEFLTYIWPSQVQNTWKVRVLISKQYHQKNCKMERNSHILICLSTDEIYVDISMRLFLYST